MWTTIPASKEQTEKIYSKYIKFPVFSLSYSYDDEDDIGFVSFYTWRGDRVEYQLRHNQTQPCFIEFKNLSGKNIRYDILYPEGLLYDRLKEIGLKAKESFWKGGQL